MTTPLNLVDQYLVELKLHGVRETLSTRMKQAKEGALAHDDFLNLCLHDEAQFRKNARVQRLLRNASFRNNANLEGIDLTTPRGIDKKLIQDLSTASFINDGLNVLIMGPTGVGKTHLATALGNAACRHGHSTLFYPINLLVEKLLLSRAQGNYLHLLKKLGSTNLLVLDDLGIKPLTPTSYQDLYDILDERAENKATIITTQLPPENWSEVIADPIVCEAITDRIVTRSVRIMMKGDSYRKKKVKNIDSI